MAIFGNTGAQAAQEAGAQAQQDLYPYTQYAGTDFDAARQGIYDALGMLQQRPNYNQGFFDYLSMTPSQLLDSAMQSYKMSPATMNEMRLGVGAANNAAIAGGMGGSGMNQLADAEISSMIYGQGMDDYLNKLLQSFGVEAQGLRAYDQPIGDVFNAFSNMLGTEIMESNQAASDALRTGQEETQSYNERARSLDEDTRMLGNQLGRMFNRRDVYF